jgi:hypothetical protein
MPHPAWGVEVNSGCKVDCGGQATAVLTLTTNTIPQTRSWGHVVEGCRVMVHVRVGYKSYTTTSTPINDAKATIAA